MAVTALRLTCPLFNIHDVWRLTSRRKLLEVLVMVTTLRVPITYKRKEVCDIYGRRTGHSVAQLVEPLRYKPEGRGFDSRMCH